MRSTILESIVKKGAEKLSDHDYPWCRFRCHRKFDASMRRAPAIVAAPAGAQEASVRDLGTRRAPMLDAALPRRDCRPFGWTSAESHSWRKLGSKSSSVSCLYGAGTVWCLSVPASEIVVPAGLGRKVKREMWASLDGSGASPHPYGPHGAPRAAPRRGRGDSDTMWRGTLCSSRPQCGSAASTSMAHVKSGPPLARLRGSMSRTGTLPSCRALVAASSRTSSISVALSGRM